MMEKYGADAVRWYMYTINQPGESKRFDEKSLSDMVRKNFTILMNVAAFYEMFASSTVAPRAMVDKPSHVLDRWILSRLNKLVKDTTDRLERYIITETVRELGSFIDDLSTWYVRRSRDRMKGEDAADRDAAIVTLQYTLLTLSKLMAPFAPFLAETLYKQAGGELESVHLADWPVANFMIDDELLEEMGRVRSVVSKALERRVDAGINVRQALGAMIVTIPSGKFAQEFQKLVQEEVNVKTMKIQKGDYAVELDLTLTPELVREGMVREIIRRVNDLRKEQGLTITDRIDLYVNGPEQVLLAVKEHQNVLLQGTLSRFLRTQGELPQQVTTFKTQECEIMIGF
ncbi:TPA: hypothetical protein DCW61_03165 [Candidatus Uhrbacteria bacterium]|nr:hypothetical protein [Candidatus Uhrbacteria bacterium]